MKATFRYMFRRYRLALVGWGLGLFLLALLMVYVYAVVGAEQAETIEELFESMPKGLISFAMMDQATTAKGFLDGKFFLTAPVLLGILAALMGSGLLVADEESGRLDLFMAYPIRRRDVFAGRLAALLLVLSGIVAAGWAGMVVGTRWFAVELAPLPLLLPFLSLLAVVVLMASLSLVLSMVLPARRYAAIGAVLVLVVSFFLSGLARVDPSLEALARLLPLSYYQGAGAIDHFNVAWFAGLLVVSAAGFALAGWRFEGRDIRVAGEGVVHWRRVALSMAVALAIVAIPIGVAMRPKVHASPEAAFDGAMAALAAEDWEAFAQELTPEAVEEWNAVMVVYGAAVQFGGKKFIGQQGPPPGVTSDQLMSLFAMMTKFRGAMRHVDTAALAGHEQTIQAVLVRSMLSKTWPRPDEQQRELGRLVKEPQKFLTKALRAWSVAHHYPQRPRLENLTTHDATARADLLLPDGQRRELTFQKIDGGWRVGLPFWPGQLRDFEKQPR